MSDPDEVRRAREAANIFRRLSEDPDDIEAQRDRDVFLARGPEERKTYARMSRGVDIAKKGVSSKKKPPYALAALAILGGAIYAAYEPLSIRLLADERTTLQARQVALASGDAVSLDASTALIDRSNEEARRVVLLQGAAFFDVERDGRAFLVEFDGVTIEVLGTAFEVAKIDDTTIVSVAEGMVDVRLQGESWQLQMGDRLELTEAGIADMRTVAPDSVGAWKDGFIITDGMTFGQVIDVIDRRVPGPIVITDQDLAETGVSGRLDLSRPRDALRTLAATSDAQVLSVGPLAIVSGR
ncbi:MAG: FecR domain-containing protein [Pseudomonadota bacterium]